MGTMKNYRQLLKELPSRSVVFAYGKFNPPTTGHELLVKTVKKLAEQRNSDHIIFASPSKDTKTSPLVVEKKIHYLEIMFPNTKFNAADEDTKNIISIAKELNEKYKNIVLVAGEDQVTELTALLNSRNGKEFRFESIEVIAAGTPDADDVKMRNFASKGLYEQFKQGLPSVIRDIDSRRLMNDIRQGLGLEIVKEEIKLVKDNIREQYFRGEIFKLEEIVESDGVVYKIVKRGSNHLLLQTEEGNLVSKWIQDVTPSKREFMVEKFKVWVEGVIQNSGTDQISFVGSVADKEAVSSTDEKPNKKVKKYKDISFGPDMNDGKINVSEQHEPPIDHGTEQAGVGAQQVMAMHNLPGKVGHTLHPTGNDNVRRRKIAYTLGEDQHDLYDLAQSHKETAEKSKSKGNMGAYHAHMVLHHETLGGWHEAKGRSSSADREYEKAEHHHNQSLKHPYMTESFHHTKVTDGENGAKIVSHGDHIKIVVPTEHHKVMKGLQHGEHHSFKNHNDEEWGIIKHGNSYVFKPHSMDTGVYGGFACQVPCDHFHGGKDTETQEVSEAHKIGDKVIMTRGPKDVVGKTGHVGEIRKRWAGDSKTYTIDHKGGSIQLKSTHFKKLKEDMPMPAAVNVQPTVDMGDPEHLRKKKAIKKPKLADDEYQVGSNNAHGFDAFFNEHLDQIAEEVTFEEIVEMYDDDELAFIDEETLEEVDIPLMEVLSRVERMLAHSRFARSASKRQRQLKIALKRTSPPAKINTRARRLAVATIKKRMFRGLDPSKVPVAQKERIEKIISSLGPVIGRLAMKLAPKVRAVEKARLHHHKYTQ